MASKYDMHVKIWPPNAKKLKALKKKTPRSTFESIVNEAIEKL